jgi:hypothetical protein
MVVVGEVFIAPTTILAVGWAFYRWAHRTRHCSVSGACNVSRPLESTVGFACPCGALDSPVRPDVAASF